MASNHIKAACPVVRIAPRRHVLPLLPYRQTHIHPPKHTPSLSQRYQNSLLPARPAHQTPSQPYRITLLRPRPGHVYPSPSTGEVGRLRPGGGVDPLPHALPHGLARCRMHKKPIFIAFGACHTPILAPRKPLLDPTFTPPNPHFHPSTTPPKPHLDPSFTPPKTHLDPTWTPHGTTIANLPAGPANPIGLKSKIRTYEEERCCKSLFYVS